MARQIGGTKKISGFPNHFEYVCGVRQVGVLDTEARCGVNMVASLLEENGNRPVEFLLGDITTFKVVLANADVMENGSNYSM